MAYNLDKKLKELEFERKQVLHHLALLDANIATLKRAIELTQQESDVALYNTDNFVYRSKYKLFKGKIRKYIVQMMREAPDKTFTIAELTQRIFDIEQNPKGFVKYPSAQGGKYLFLASKTKEYFEKNFREILIGA